ncbi:MAG: hypothetical protein ACKO37_03185 [Vampirovibrionales bacterium]
MHAFSLTPQRLKAGLARTQKMLAKALPQGAEMKAMRSPVTRLSPRVPSSRAVSQAPSYTLQTLSSDLLVGNGSTEKLGGHASTQLHVLHRLEPTGKRPVRAWVSEEPSFWETKPSSRKPLASFTVHPEPPSEGTEFDVYPITKDTAFHRTLKERSGHSPTHVLKLASTPRQWLMQKMHLSSQEQLALYPRKRHVDAFFNQAAQDAQGNPLGTSVRDALKTQGVDVLPLNGLYQGKGQTVQGKPSTDFALIQPHVSTRAAEALKPLPSLSEQPQAPVERQAEVQSYHTLHNTYKFLQHQPPIQVKGRTVADGTSVMDDVGAQNVYVPKALEASHTKPPMVLPDMGSFRESAADKPVAETFSTIFAIKYGSLK